MKINEVEGLFALAGIKILKLWKLQNRYYGSQDEPDPSHYERIIKSPWWLVKTEFGLIELGWRKKVLHIEWEDTPIRKIVTEDNVTKTETYVHAWDYPSAIAYLKNLAEQKPLTADDYRVWRG